MDFKKGWGIIERLLLIVGVIGSILATTNTSEDEQKVLGLIKTLKDEGLNLASGFAEFFVPNGMSVAPLSIILCGIVWAPFLGARIIGWIAKNLIRKRQEELK